MLEIRTIDKACEKDMDLKNEPFPLWGRMVPELHNGVWSYTVEKYDTLTEMTFPDDEHDFDAFTADEGVAFGAYEDGKCIGNAIFTRGFFKYMYLEDLKVSTAARGKGVGRALIRAGLEEALRRNYRGIYLQAQDNNLNACLFYLKCGFQIGGFDNRVYTGTKQADKADIVFYLDGEQ